MEKTKTAEKLLNSFIMFFPELLTREPD